MLNVLNRLFGWRASDAKHKVGLLYGAIMTQARSPRFFEDFGVPDQFENRFELLTLHMFLVLERLKREGAAGRPLARMLTEYMVSDLDRTCREMGVGDVGVVKRMKAFMSGFYGRVLAYDKALHNSDAKEILRALDKNLYGNVSTDIPRLEAMRAYIRHQEERLAATPLNDLQNGLIRFTFT